MSKLVVRPEAFADSQSIAWDYESKLMGLGAQFLEALAESISRIEAMLTAFPVVHRSYRRCKVGHFPFAIFFEIMPDMIAVLAVSDLRQDPASWRANLDRR